MIMGHTERRRDSRSSHASLIEYTTSAKDGAENDSRARGVTINISTSGLCMYIFHPLQEGQRLRISSNPFLRKTRLAQVRWAKLVTGDIYKAGLMFSSAIKS